MPEDEVAIRTTFERLGGEQLNTDLIGRDAKGNFPRDEWLKCASAGVQGLPIPVEHGGSGATPSMIATALEALGYGCRDNGLLFSLNAQMWGCEVPILRFGTPEQRDRYLPALCDGSTIGAQAMTEPDTGSDAFALTTTATSGGAGWIINGTKTFVTNAPVADVLVVFATTDRERGMAAITAFLVDASTPGVEVGPPFEKMGLRTSPIAQVTFDGCEIPADAMLGKDGGGFSVFNTAMDWERTFIMSSAVGTMQRQLEACIAFANERTQFGQPIGKFQAVSHRIVDMKMRLETCRLLLHDVASRKAVDRPSPLDASMVKLHLSESFLQSSLDAVQIHGGGGYTADLEFERDVRDAMAARLYSGTSEIQREVIARRLGL